MNYPPAQVPEEDPPLSLHSALVIQVPFLYVWPDDLHNLKKFNFYLTFTDIIIYDYCINVGNELIFYLRRRHFTDTTSMFELDNCEYAKN